MNTAVRFSIIICAIFSLTMLSGCQEQAKQAVEDENIQLKETIQKQQTEISQLKKARDINGTVLQEVLSELQKCQTENLQLKQQKTPAKSPKVQTPDEKAKIQQGIEQLRQLQRESAERMRKEGK